MCIRRGCYRHEDLTLERPCPRVPGQRQHGLGKKIPPYGFEYPGYLRLPPLIQTGAPSSTPQTFQIGYLLTEAMT